MPQPSPLDPQPSSVDESSVLVSLSELLDLESERLRDEEFARREEQQKTEHARLQRERQQQEEEQARLVALDEQIRRTEQLRREEDARLFAIQAAELEKARLVAESQVRLRLMAQEQAHQENIARILEGGSKKKLRLGLAFSALAFVGLSVFGIVLFRVREAQVSHEVERLQKAARDKERELDLQIKALQQRLGRLDTADNKTRVVLQDEIEKLTRQRGSWPDAEGSKEVKPKITQPSRTERREPRQDPPPPKRPCPEGDPMCPL
jgi:colicin import membrane protein